MSLQQKVAERAEVEAAEIIGKLREIRDRCMEAEPVRDRQGNVIEGQYQFNANAAIRATELLGKTIALFTDRLDLPNRDLSTLSDKELDALATKLGLT